MHSSGGLHGSLVKEQHPTSNDNNNNNNNKNNNNNNNNNPFPAAPPRICPANYWKYSEYTLDVQKQGRVDLFDLLHPTHLFKKKKNAMKKTQDCEHLDKGTKKNDCRQSSSCRNLPPFHCRKQIFQPCFINSALQDCINPSTFSQPLNLPCQPCLQCIRPIISPPSCMPGLQLPGMLVKQFHPPAHSFINKND